MWFSVQARFLIASTVGIVAAVGVGLLGGGWVWTAAAAVLIGISGLRILWHRREDPDRYSTPQPWGKLPPPD
jgi:hypothetical protein